MGIHVIVVDRNGNKHPTWDWIRHAGDRGIPEAVDNAGLVEGDWQDFDIPSDVRPADIDKFVEEMIAICKENDRRWRELGEILKDGDRWWLRFSF